MNDTHVTSKNESDALSRMAEIYKSRFIGVDDLKDAGAGFGGKKLTFKIKSVATEQLESIVHKGRKIEGSEKGVITLDRPADKKRELILNKTSYRNLVAAWGKSGWAGKSLVVYVGKVNGKEAVLCESSGGVEKSAPNGPVTSPPKLDKKDDGALAPPDDLEFPDDKIPEE